MLDYSRAIVHRFFDEVLGRGDLAVLDEILAPGYVAHVVGLPRPITGIEALKRPLVLFRSTFPDARFTIEDEIIVNSKAVVAWTMAGTHQGQWMGMPATGNRVTVTGICICYISDARVISTRVQADLWGLFQQLGDVPLLEQLEL